MTSLSAARTLALAAILVTMIDVIHGYFVWDVLDDTVARLLGVNGFQAIIDPPSWLYDVYYVCQFVTLMSVVANIKYSRYLFALNVSVFLVVTPFLGIAVALPIQTFIGLLVSYSYGAILILLFSPFCRTQNVGATTDDENVGYL